MQEKRSSNLTYYKNEEEGMMMHVELSLEMTLG
jgi:hypothetical protein